MANSIGRKVEAASLQAVSRDRLPEYSQFVATQPPRNSIDVLMILLTFTQNDCLIGTRLSSRTLGQRLMAMTQGVQGNGLA